jgi:hypothetical protein
MTTSVVSLAPHCYPTSKNAPRWVAQGPHRCSGLASLADVQPTPAFGVPKIASDEVLRQITNDNPRRFLAFVPKVKRKV